MDFLKDPVTFLANQLVLWLTGLGLPEGVVRFLSFSIGAAILATSSLLFVIFLIWFERKLIGRVQDRLGPNRLGPFGLFQPFADMLKIFTKEYVTPSGVDPVPYNLAPVLAVSSVMAIWAVIPFANTIYGVDLDVGVVFVLAVGGLAQLGIILAGWGSNNKYALLGGFRALAQLLSYEIPMVITLLIPVMLAGTLSLTGMVTAQDVPFVAVAPLAALIFFIANLAEVSRAPFDLPEADSEIVAGFNIEYSGLKFGFFYVAEFLHGFTSALLFATVFLGGWRGPLAEEIPILGFIYFAIKTSLVYLTILLVDATVPRFRIDQLLNFSWKLLTPLALALLVAMALVDRAMVGMGVESIWIRLPVFLALNAGLFAAGAYFLDRARRRAPRPVVSGGPRPVARPENFAMQPK